MDFEDIVHNITNSYRAGAGLPLMSNANEPCIPSESELYRSLTAADMDYDPDYARQDAESRGGRRNMDHYLDNQRHGQGDK